jgi:hypothetical protein
MTGAIYIAVCYAQVPRRQRLGCRYHYYYYYSHHHCYLKELTRGVFQKSERPGCDSWQERRNVCIAFPTVLDPASRLSSEYRDKVAGM